MDLNDEGLDVLLRKLGEGAPFDYDRPAFAARLAAHMPVVRIQPARNAWRAGLLGGLLGSIAGAAAMYLVVMPAEVTPHAGVSTRNTTAVSPVDPPQSAPIQFVSFHNGTIARTSAPEVPAPTAPYESSILREDGTQGGIRFEGFSAAATQNGFIAARADH